MRDLLLWRMLTGETPADEPFAKQKGDSEMPLLGGLLMQLAGRPLIARFPFFGPIAELLGHPMAMIRAAAVRALAGATGTLAFQALVRGLADDALEVRLAAVEALAVSARNDGPRWVHALFHSDPLVRQAAVEIPAPPGAAWYPLLLLADEDCREAITGKLHQIVPPAGLIDGLDDMVRKGWLSRGALEQMVLRMGWSACWEWAWKATGRSPETCQLVQSLLLRGETDVLERENSRDVLDTLWGIVWTPFDSQDPEADDRLDAFFDAAILWAWRLADSVASEFYPRIFASLAVVAAERGHWSPRAARLAVLLFPQFILAATVPWEVRRQACEVFYHLGGNSRECPDDQVRELITSPACRTESGLLDLRMIGGLLHLASPSRFKKLREWLGTEQVVSSFVADMEGFSPLFTLADAEPKERDELLSAIALHDHGQIGMLRAILVRTLPADRLQLLEGLDVVELTEVCDHLQRLNASARPLSTSKVNRISALMVTLLAPRADADVRPFDRFLLLFLEGERPEQFELGLDVLGGVAAALDTEAFVLLVQRMPLARLRKLLAVFPYCPRMPFGKEMALREGLARHTDGEIRAWASGGTKVVPPAAPATRVGTVEALPASVRNHIATCSTADIEKAVLPALRAPGSGLVGALAGRPSPLTCRPAVAAALVVAHDPWYEVDAPFLRFASPTGDPPDPMDLTEIDALIVAHCTYQPCISPLGHAWLHLWEQHLLAFEASLAEGVWAASPDGTAERAIPDSLRAVLSMKSRVLVEQVYRATARLLEIWRHRGQSRIAHAAKVELRGALLEGLDSDQAELAAEMFVSVFKSHAAPQWCADSRGLVMERMPELSEAVRAILAPWIDSSGMAATSSSLRRGKREVVDTSWIRRLSDLDELAAVCRRVEPELAAEAALVLIDREDDGLLRLAQVLCSPVEVPCAVLLAETLPLWPARQTALALMESLARDPATDTELQFVLATGFWERGDASWRDVAFASACRESPRAWFAASDWQRLRHLGASDWELAIALTIAPHPPAYTRAVKWLCDAVEIGEAEIDAMRAFLETGSERLRELRILAAGKLREWGSLEGLPVALEGLLHGYSFKSMLAGLPPSMVARVTASFLVAGQSVAQERLLLELLGAKDVDPDGAELALRELLSWSASDPLRTEVVSRLRRRPARDRKMKRVAENFAWGVLMGRELTGRIFTVEMIGGDDLGYTRLNESTIYITPLPLLRDEENADAVVRGLILHEYGHHMYHRGPEKEDIWKQGEKEHMHSLLNLVSDEHLERNLRAIDEDFGDKLKQLAAYAFQHARSEIAVDQLLLAMGSRAMAALTSVTLRAARRAGCVGVDHGQLLRELERGKLSFARFMRALRMGLGDRHDDPRVAAGLKLFKGAFRKKSMAELLEIARELRQIFGEETALLECLGQDSAMKADERSIAIDGEGLSREELLAEIQRVLNPNKNRDKDVSSKAGSLFINVAPDEDFAKMETVVPLRYDPVARASLAKEVARPARHMRKFLADLGFVYTPQRHRVQGRQFDRSRTQAVVTRGDPRMLIARKKEIRVDLFLGLVIDCSGSMQAYDNIEKARRFGALMAESARGLVGIDVRIFGFTDSVIYDAGDAERCAVHALQAGGGNNDAAALWHAALAAANSRRRSKLLIMISDGLPTECSVAALRGLVHKLTTRMKMCCAQVAVHPLLEPCFDHYIELQASDLDASVRKFGEIVARLVKRTLG